MYAVLIVDDEPWVTYGISKLINWEQLGFIVVGEAHDGLTAISMIEHYKPDVVISDIRMPGLDGIELLREIRKRDLQTEVILVSGYSEFEYAQQALKLGAFDYLLKQIEKELLTDTITRLKLKLDKKQRISEVTAYFLNDLFELLDADNRIEISKFLGSRAAEFEYPHYRFVSSQYPDIKISEKNRQEAAYNGIHYLSFPTGQNKLSLLINYDEAKHPNLILDFVASQLHDADHIGISSRSTASAVVSKLFQEADIALFSSICHPTSRVIEYREQVANPELSSVILQLELAIKEQRSLRVNELLDFISDCCMEQGMLIDQVTGIYNQIVALTQKYYGMGTSSQSAEYLTYYQVARYGSYSSLFSSLQILQELHTDLEPQPSSDQVKDILAYIDERITDDFVLGDVAKHFFISISSLSSLIKKSTGTSYSKYVTNKRIQLAKELLADSSLSVQEVAHRVGYKDYFYFNKLFKKYVGLTPSKFRKI